MGKYGKKRVIVILHMLWLFDIHLVESSDGAAGQDAESSHGAAARTILSIQTNHGSISDLSDLDEMNQSTDTPITHDDKRKKSLFDVPVLSTRKSLIVPQNTPTAEEARNPRLSGSGSSVSFLNVPLSDKLPSPVIRKKSIEIGSDDPLPTSDMVAMARRSSSKIFKISPKGSLKPFDETINFAVSAEMLKQSLRGSLNLSGVHTKRGSHEDANPNDEPLTPSVLALLRRRSELVPPSYQPINPLNPPCHDDEDITEADLIAEGFVPAPGKKTP